jgi:hypothetical protein
MDIKLKNKSPLKVSEIPELIARSFYPDDEPVNGEQPAQLRWWMKQRIKKEIDELFLSGEFQLIDPISKRPVLKSYVDKTAPSKCFMFFDTFVEFAALSGVCVTHSEADSKHGARKPRELKNYARDRDFKKWIEEFGGVSKLDDLIKKEIKSELIKRDAGLWASGFEDWWTVQKIYKGKPGRRKRN